MKEVPKMEKLKPGEKYLSISLLGGQVKLAAFINKNKRSDDSPDFTGPGISIWVNKKKEETVEEDII